MADFGAILTTLRSELGKPYVWGATGPSSFDCSGLVQYAYGQHGISLPRTSAEQAKVGQTIPKGQQQPGDLVFSNWEGGSVVSHVGVYIGGGQMIEASQSGTPVHVVPLSASYMAHVKNIQRVSGPGGFTGAGEVSGLATATGSAQASGDPFAGVSSALGGIGKSFASINELFNGDPAKGTHGLSWLMLPTSWVRIASGVAGVGLVFFGLHKLVSEVRT